MYSKLLVLISCMSLAACSLSPPNVILIMTDDQGYGDIGAHGSPYVNTPAMDRLHEQSIRLTNFHVDPCCAPSRSALLTGQYSSRTGVWHTIGGRSLLGTDNVTMAEVFRDAGYHTGVFGKWHLGENYPFRPMDRGFEESVIHRGGGLGSNPDRRDNDYFDGHYVHNGVDEFYPGYCNTVWFEEALKFIQTSGDEPFFCYISSNVPHAPLLVDSSYAIPYRSMVSDRLANYYGMVTKVDEDLGVFLQQIDDLGLRENTILIFMTDNGPCPWFGGIIINEDGFPVEGYSAGMRGGKIWGYENAHRVPCYISWPKGGLDGGKDINTLTAHIDLLPSLIDWCNLPLPDGAEFDGRSLSSLLSNGQTDWDERLLFVHNQRVDIPVKYKEYQVLSEQWRLVKRDTTELFDILKDPGQKRDVAGDHPDVVINLFEQYEAWWEHINPDMTGFNHIILGNDHENPSMLFAHDAHRERPDPDYWMVHFDRQGKYTFKPHFRDFRMPISANQGSQSDLNQDMTYYLNIGDQNFTWKADSIDGSDRFQIELEKGDQKIAVWAERKGQIRRAYSLEVVYQPKL